ncbi:MAG: DUF374 domain-containing protein [Hyphomicrobiaceae bacterium]|nr:DUF374 domain-containing protein [Hyphomicrobiaceae bacterium]
MARDFLKRLGVPGSVGRGIARLVRMVARTSEPVFEPADLTQRLFAAHPGILTFWHGQFMLVSLLNPHGATVKAMVARHGDAELIGQALEHVGVELIRGAGSGGRRKDRGGAHALRASMRALADGATVAMTADVPPGPARRAGEGVIMLARLSGRPIMPVAVATSRFLALDTWSRMTINLPYSKIAAVGGEHIIVPRDADAATIEALRQKLETSLNEATRRAYELVGSDYTKATPAGALPASAPPAEPGFRFKAYRQATRLIEPVLPLWLASRARKGKEVAIRRNERYGLASTARPEGRLVWLHAASVGETNAALPLIAELTAREPDLSFLLTTGTVTSAQLAAQRLGPRAIHQFAPLDTRRFTRRFLDHWRPDLVVFTESEIWPNQIIEIAARNIPIAIVNARMSPRSFARWRRSRGLARPLFSRFNVVLTQNERLTRWFTQLGARCVRTSGNLKIDSPPPPIDPLALERLKQAIGARPMLLAASTHPGEDEQVIAAHKQLAGRHAGFLTIIVPRHPDRGGDITALVRQAGLTAGQRAAGQLPDAATDIYVADTIGELGTFYALASIAFIGGSLVPHGGQNPIEAVRHGAAVITGPHTRNFEDQVAALAARNGLMVVNDAASLAAATSKLLTDPDAIARIDGGARAAIDGMTGALARTADAVIELLPRMNELRRAS